MAASGGTWVKAMIGKKKGQMLFHPAGGKPGGWDVGPNGTKIWRASTRHEDYRIFGKVYGSGGYTDWQLRTKDNPSGTWKRLFGVKSADAAYEYLQSSGVVGFKNVEVITKKVKG